MGHLFDEDALVIGLGRFGEAAAQELARLGYRVHAIDIRSDIGERYSRRFMRVLNIDAAKPHELAQAKPGNFRIAVIGIGTQIESSLMVASNLVDAKVEQIWAKAISPVHAKILTRIGVHQVIYPEAESGRRVAHLVNGRLKDYIEFDDEYAIVKMTPPEELIGFTLAETDVRKKYGVTVVGVKKAGEDFTYATPETKIVRNAELIVSGPSTLIERLAARP